MPPRTGHTPRSLLVPGEQAGVAMLAFAFAFCLLARTVADPDLWGHVRFGQDVLRTGQLAQIDPYAYTSGGQPWINHEWLCEVLFAATYDALGVPGLVGLKSALAMLVFGACYGSLVRSGLDPVRAMIVLPFVGWALLPGLIVIRPQLFTFVGFLIVLLAIDAAERGRPAWLAVVPPTIAVWVNLHGGVLAGVGVLGIWASARALDLAVRGSSPGGLPRRREIAWPPAIVALSVLALLANPYGPRLLAFLLHTATGSRPEIADWAPLKIASVTGFVYLVLLAASCAGLLLSRRRPDPARVAALVVVALTPLMATRHLPLFGLAAVVLAGPHLADAWRRLDGPAAEPARPRPAFGMFAVAASLLLIAAGLYQARSIRIEPKLLAYPARAVGLLQSSGVRGNLATPFNWGEYALWHLGPDVKVSLDGRRETVYPEPTYRRLLDFEDGTNAWDAVLRDYDTTMALVQKGSPPDNLLRLEPGWVLVHDDPTARLYVRADAPQLDRLAATPVPDLPDDGGGLSFPVDPVASPRSDSRRSDLAMSAEH